MQTLPCSIRLVGAYILKEFGVAYESRAGLIKRLHRPGLEYQKPEVIGRKLDVAKQKAFYAKTYPRGGANSAAPSPTTSALSTQSNFGSWRRRSIY